MGGGGDGGDGGGGGGGLAWSWSYWTAPPMMRKLISTLSRTVMIPGTSVPRLVGRFVFSKSVSSSACAPVPITVDFRTSGVSGRGGSTSRLRSAMITKRTLHTPRGHACFYHRLPRLIKAQNGRVW